MDCGSEKVVSLCERRRATEMGRVGYRRVLTDAVNWIPYAPPCTRLWRLGYSIDSKNHFVGIVRNSGKKIEIHKRSENEKLV